MSSLPHLTKRYCPLSEEFFYWPPEEIDRYKHWCEVNYSRECQMLTEQDDKEMKIKPQI